MDAEPEAGAKHARPVAPASAQERGEAREPGESLPRIVKVPPVVVRIDVGDAVQPLHLQGVVESAFIAGRPLVGVAGDVVEKLPIRPFIVRPVRPRPTGQPPDLRDTGQRIGVTRDPFEGFESEADEPGLEVEEAIVGAPALHDDRGRTPHQPAVDPLALRREVQLELDDRRRRPPGQLLSQPLGALILIPGHDRGPVDQLPEIAKAHPGKLPARGQTARPAGTLSSPVTGQHLPVLRSPLRYRTAVTAGPSRPRGLQCLKRPDPGLTQPPQIPEGLDTQRQS